MHIIKAVNLIGGTGKLIQPGVSMVIEDQPINQTASSSEILLSETAYESMEYSHSWALGGGLISYQNTKTIKTKSLIRRN